MVQEVTQADREAAADYYYSEGGSASIVGAIRDGEKDAWFRVQAFARHRQAALATADADIAALRGEVSTLVAEREAMQEAAVEQAYETANYRADIMIILQCLEYGQTQEAIDRCKAAIAGKTYFDPDTSTGCADDFSPIAQALTEGARDA